MKRHNTVFDEAIRAYRSAVSEGRAYLPRLGSAWYKQGLDDYFTSDELVSIATQMYSKQQSGPSTLAYVLEHGNEVEKNVVRERFYEWWDTGVRDNYFSDWLYLARYFVRDDRRLLDLVPYVTGGVLREPNDDVSEFWLHALEPHALQELVEALRQGTQHLRGEPESLEQLCNLFIPLGAEAEAVLPNAIFAVLAEAVVDTWNLLRFAPQEEGMMPLPLSWDRLKWCWVFGWEHQLDQLSSQSLFCRDCLGQSLNGEWPFLIAEDVAENCMILSLTRQQGVLYEGSLDNLFEEHVKAALLHIERSAGAHPRELTRIAEQLMWGNSYPTEIPSQEQKLKWCFGGRSPHDPELGELVHYACCNVWRIRLALAIVHRRRIGLQARAAKPGVE